MKLIKKKLISICNFIDDDIFKKTKKILKNLIKIN